MKISKAERTRVLRAVDDAWTHGYDDQGGLNDMRLLRGGLYEIAHDVLMILDAEPWRNFGDVLNEVLDY